MGMDIGMGSGDDLGHTGMGMGMGTSIGMSARTDVGILVITY